MVYSARWRFNGNCAIVSVGIVNVCLMGVCCLIVLENVPVGKRDVVASQRELFRPAGNSAFRYFGLSLYSMLHETFIKYLVC